MSSTFGQPKIPIFEKFQDYREWVRQTLFPHPVFLENPIVSNLIDWVLYHSAPLYYWAANEEERYAYLGCYRIIPIVHFDGPYVGHQDRYRDPLIVGLTHLHEFAHDLFYYPYSLRDITAPWFDRLMQERESAASNFSEVVVHYLVPELDELTRDVFFRPSWFDRLKELGFDKMPKLSQIYIWRRLWLEDPETWNNVWAPGAKYAGLRNYMQRFVNGNEDFNFARFQRLMGVEGFADPGFGTLEPTSYLSGLENFTPHSPELAQLNFERNQVLHYQLLCHLLDLPNPPRNFRELLVRRGELDKQSIVL